ncbi:MAG: hypothetical protein LBS67_05995, partial [Clostridiales Family XIII bacterium]|nr:hypothetical protein [Clostridiales Family XIII bacterium]
MIQRFILAEGLSLETRRVNTMLAFGFLVAVGCTITRIVTQAPLLSLVNQIAFILSVVVAAVAYNKFKLHTLTIYATVIFLNFILFPLTLLLNGGLRADMSGFFAMGIVIIVMLLPWKKALPFVALDIAWTIACYTIVRKFPDIVLTPSNPEYPFIDHIGSFLMIALFFAFVIRVDELLYERERLKVNETAAIISDQAQFRSTVNNAAAALLNASTEDFEKVFFKSLGAVAEHLDMERVYIMRNYNDEDGTYASPVFEWAREAYEDTGTTRFYYDKDTEWYKILFAGDTISGPLNEMSPGMTGILEKFGTKTVLSVPVFRNNAFDGYVFFANHTIERHFSENELGIARSASLIMYNAMLRNETVISLVSAREEALSASKAKSDFLSNMSHEMRTPMNAIMGMLDIARDTDDIEKKDYSLEKMSEASTHLLSIINDVLDMSKIEANKLELSPVDFSFRKLIDKIVTVSAVHVKQDQRFVADIDPEIPDRLHGDDQRLSQVVTNLLSNAMKFTPEGGEIRLDAKLLAKENNRYKIAIHIADTGIGISEEQQALLFSPFQQAES